MKNLKGFFLTITKYMVGRKMPPWMMSPTITVIMYIPSCLATTSKSAMEMIFPQIRQAIPSGEYLTVDTRGCCDDNHLHLRSTGWSNSISKLIAFGCTYHMMALTSLMTMSFKTLKKSNISLAFSPIFPIITPKATKNPIKPERHGTISPLIVMLPRMLTIV